MELIQISSVALKISLTKEDMEFYDIEFDTLDYKNTETRHILKNILEEAKRTFGFESTCDKLYIQAFRSNCGGCELFVRKEYKNGCEEKPLLFKFESIELLLCGCAKLKLVSNNTESIAYFGDDGSFFLEIYDTSHKLPLFEISKEIEYKKEFLAEHATVICEDAISKLSNLC